MRPVLGISLHDRIFLCLFWYFPEQNRLVICYWPSTAQPFLVSGSVGTHDHIIFARSQTTNCFEMAPPLRREEPSDNYWQLLTTTDHYWQLLTTTDHYWQLLTTTADLAFNLLSQIRLCDLHAVCVSANPIMLNFEYLNQYLWNFVSMSWHLIPSQRGTS
jgi:hypothetical protein